MVSKHRLAFTEQTKGNALHQVATEPIAEGQEILSSQLTKDTSEVGLAALIPEGHRATAITVTDETTGAGLLRPGDYVDVVATFAVNASPPPNVLIATASGDPNQRLNVAEIIAQNVKVLAVGQTALQPKQSSTNVITAALSPEAEPARSVTLALTPEEMQRVFLAESVGSLHLAGRRLGDQDSASLPVQDNQLQSLRGPEP